MAIQSINQSAPQMRPTSNMPMLPPGGGQGAPRAVVSQDAMNFSNRPIPDLSVIRSMQNINSIAGDGLGYFTFDNMPSYQYQSTRTRTHKDGTQETYTVYNWGAAFADVRAKLTAIQAIAMNEPDGTSRQIAMMAQQALMQNNFEQMFDSGSNASRYVALSVCLRNIQQLTGDTPAQPSATVGNMKSAISNADATIGQLRGALANGTIADRGLDAKVAARVKKDQDGVAAIPTWKKWAGVGLIQQHNFNSDAKDVQDELSAVRSANPDALAGRLNDDRQRANGVVGQAFGVRSMDDARSLASAASPVTSDANGITNQAAGLRDKINDLIKRLNDGK